MDFLQTQPRADKLVGDLVKMVQKTKPTLNNATAVVDTCCRFVEKYNIKKSLELKPAQKQDLAYDLIQVATSELLAKGIVTPLVAETAGSQLSEQKATRDLINTIIGIWNTKAPVRSCLSMFC